MAHLFGIEVPVPGAQGEIALLAIDGLLDGRRFPFSPRPCSRHDIAHKSKSSIRGFCHLILQLPVGITRKAQQPGLLRPHLRQTQHQLAGVILIAFFGAGHASMEQRFAGLAIAQTLQRRLLSGVLQHQQPGIFQSARAGFCLSDR